MTARELNLGWPKAIFDYNCLLQQNEDALSKLKTMQEQARSPQLLQEISDLKKKICLHKEEILCYEAQVLDDEFLKCVLFYYRLMVAWLVKLAGGQVPLLPICSKEFDFMPVHFVEDTMDFLTLASKVVTRDMHMMGDFFKFIIMFMASPEYISNPHLRFKMVGVLYDWFSDNSNHKVILTFFQRYELSFEYVVKNLFKLYADKELSYEWQPESLERYTIKLNITKILRHLWSNRSVSREMHKKTDEEKSVYVYFMNSFIDDTTSLLAYYLKRILKLEKQEAQLPTPAVEMRQLIRIETRYVNAYVKTLSFISMKMIAPFFLPEMAQKVAFALRFILVQLCQPPDKFINLSNPGELMFQRKDWLKEAKCLKCRPNFVNWWDRNYVCGFV